MCPFHGPIVLRDAEGNPIEQKETWETLEETKGEVSTEATDVVALVDMDSFLGSVKEMTEELAKQAVKTVREREKKEVNMLKRAKLAKVFKSTMKQSCESLRLLQLLTRKLSGRTQRHQFSVEAMSRKRRRC